MIRVITGLIMAAIVTVAILYLPASALKIAIAALAALGIYEFSRMALPRHPTSSISLVVFLGTSLTLAVMFGHSHPVTFLVSIPIALMLSFLFYLFREHSFELVLAQVSRTFLGVIYGGFLFSFLGLIRDLWEGTTWLLLVLATTFGADTGAYFSGHLWGRHKLAPHVSPSKTVEGFLGGLFASVGVAFLCKWVINPRFSIKDCLCVGILVGMVGPLGDLSESLIKRSVGVKDSGNIIPGHGGFLDRVDALLFTSPVVYYYAAYFR